MKRIIWILIIIAIGAYFINYYFDKKAKEKAKLEETKKIENAIKTSINDMVMKFNAISDWDNVLSNGKNVRIEKILTIELERLWLGEKPILFMGSIEDVSTLDEKNYLIRIERNLFNPSKLFLGTDLVLELKIKKEILDLFLSSHPDFFSDYGLNNGVALVAKIIEIKTEFFLNKEGDKEEIKIGVGECLGVLYTGRVYF